VVFKLPYRGRINKKEVDMKKFIEPISLVVIEVLLLLFLDFDKSAIYLIGAATFGYFFIKRGINQNEAVINARSHKIIANNFRVNPYDTQTLQKGLSFEREVSNNPVDHRYVKWIHLLFSTLNIIALVLVFADILPV